MAGHHELRPTRRFSRRAADYVRFRPSYPSELLAWLRDAIGFAPSWRVADVGSGTGIFTRLLIENGNHVHGVEPNDAMRLEAETALSAYDNFTSVRGSAEATSLPERAFDLVTAAQAFHWFDPAATQREFQRILKPGGWVLIAFNSRRANASPFMQAYEQFLHARAVDYTSVDHRGVDDVRLLAFLGDYRAWRFHFSVVHDLEGLIGLSSSSSYTPAPGHPEHTAFYAALREVFEAHEHNGQVEFLYETEAYLGKLS